MVVTGAAFPIGDGGVGKTALARAFAFFDDCNIGLICEQDTRKTVNMEFEFVRTECEYKNEAIMIQLYVPPGQRSEEQALEVGSFEKILDTYEFMPNMQKISVLLLVFKMNEFETFAGLEKWLKTVLLKGLVKQFTSIVLVGTHMDEVHREVETYQIEEAVKFVGELVNSNVAGWQGDIDYALVSNVTGQGICELRTMVAEYVCMANFIRESIGDSTGHLPCAGCSHVIRSNGSVNQEST